MRIHDRQENPSDGRSDTVTRPSIPVAKVVGEERRPRPFRRSLRAIGDFSLLVASFLVSLLDAAAIPIIVLVLLGALVFGLFCVPR